MDLNEVEWAEKAYIALCNVKVRINLETTRNQEHGEQLTRWLRWSDAALRMLNERYGHLSKVIPGMNDYGHSEFR